MGGFNFFPIWFANIMIKSFLLDIYSTVSVVIDYIHTVSEFGDYGF